MVVKLSPIHESNFIFSLYLRVVVNSFFLNDSSSLLVFKIVRTQGCIFSQVFSLLPRSITRSEWPWLACVLPGAQRKKVFLKFYDINSQRRALWGIINYKPLFKLKWYSWDFIILLITDNHIRFSILALFSDVIDHWIILSIVKTVVFLFK